MTTKNPPESTGGQRRKLALIPEFDDNRVVHDGQDDQPSLVVLANLAKAMLDAEEHWTALPDHYALLGRCFLFGLEQGSGDGRR